MEEKKYVIVKTKRMIRKISTDDIDYITQDARKVRVVCKEAEYEFYDKVANVAENLGSNFVEILKFSYANFDRVMAMEDQYIEFFDGNKFYLGITSFTAAKQKFSAYLFLD